MPIAQNGCIVGKQLGAKLKGNHGTFNQLETLEIMWPPPLLQLGVPKGRATPLLKLIVTIDWLGKPKFGLKRGPIRTLVCCECKECSWNYTKLSYLNSSLPWTSFKWPLSFVCWICISNLVHLNILAFVHYYTWANSNYNVSFKTCGLFKTRV